MNELLQLRIRHLEAELQRLREAGPKVVKAWDRAFHHAREVDEENIKLRAEVDQLEKENARFRNALDWIEAEPENPIQVQLWARAALEQND